jgi:hypothetical protein
MTHPLQPSAKKVMWDIYCVPNFVMKFIEKKVCDYDK